MLNNIPFTTESIHKLHLFLEEIYCFFELHLLTDRYNVYIVVFFFGGGGI
jgi:hypothetical protein